MTCISQILPAEADTLAVIGCRPERRGRSPLSKSTTNNLTRAGNWLTLPGTFADPIWVPEVRPIGGW